MMTPILCFFVWMCALFDPKVSGAFAVLCFLAWLSSINDD